MIEELYAVQTYSPFKRAWLYYPRKNPWRSNERASYLARRLRKQGHMVRVLVGTTVS